MCQCVTTGSFGARKGWSCVAVGGLSLTAAGRRSCCCCKEEGGQPTRRRGGNQMLLRPAIASHHPASAVRAMLVASFRPCSHFAGAGEIFKSEERESGRMGVVPWIG